MRDEPAEVIPLAYYANATTSTRTTLNVPAMAMDLAGNAWFVLRTSGRPYSYVATATALNHASGGTSPARAVRSTPPRRPRRRGPQDPDHRPLLRPLVLRRLTV